MVDPVFRKKSSRATRKISSWLECLVRGRQRRQLRRATPAAAAVSVEHLEERALLTAAPFSPEVVITTAPDGPRVVISADIDGDGDLDLVTASENDNTIAWWENVNGDATLFDEHLVSTGVNGARSVFAADMDGDGDLDIISASPTDDTIAWHENENGDGLTWNETVISTMADDARSVFAADVNGDGNLDVISASYEDDKIAWYDNSMGDGTVFTEIVVSMGADGANSVFATDFNQDGNIDIVAASQLDNTVWWFNNDMGNGLSMPANVVSNSVMGASSVSVADIDDDGDLDIVSSSPADDTIFWHENEQIGFGPITFTDRVVDTNADGANGVFTIDIENDGDVDILSASSLDDRVALYENDGDPFNPVFTSRDLNMMAEGAYSVIAADIDGDGDVDVISASGVDGKIAMYRNESIHRGAIFRLPDAIRNAAQGAYSVAIGDIDRDGDMDVATGSVYSGEIHWYENDGDPDNPTFTEHLVGTQTGVRSIHLVNLVGGDGSLNIAFASAVNNTVGYYSNATIVNTPGSPWTLTSLSASATAARSVSSGDINGDGITDLVSASSGDNTIRWFEFSPAGGVTAQTITTTAMGARDVTVGDVDGDGDLDVIVASYYDNRIAWYENGNGDGSVWARRLVSVTSEGARSVAVADLDGDGDLDIISASTYDHTVAWYENDGAANPAFTPRLLSAGEQGAQFVSVADLDQDGDLDVISVAEFPDVVDVSRIAYFMNDGAANPTFTRNAVDTTNDRPVSVATGDLDGDGDLDLVSASIISDTYLAYRNGGGQLGLTTEDTTPAEFVAGVSDDIFKVTATHNGRMGDSDLELATFELQFESTPGVPLTTTQVNQLIFDLDIYLDDGDGVFDELSDTLVTTVDPLALDPQGDLTVAFNDADMNIQITFGTPKVYFVAVETAINSFLLNPKTFRVTHVTESSSTAEDAVSDFAASIDFATNVSTPVIDIAQPNVPIPGVPSVTGPVGVATDTTPTITWTASVGAERYDLMVMDVETGQFVVNEQGIIGPIFTVLNPLEIGKTYEVLVQAINVAGETGGFSSPEYFSIDPVAVTPAIPTLTGPISAVIDTTPTITWTESPTATSYDLLVYNIRLGKQVLNPQGVPGTSFTTMTPLPPDRYQVFVRANNAGSSSTYSSSLIFTTATPTGVLTSPILTGPKALIPDNTPTITWTDHLGAIDYDLLVYSLTKGQEVLNVPGIGGTEFTTPALPTPDRYQVFVRATLPGMVKTVYSTPLVFEVTSKAPIPGVTKIETPSRDTTDSTPTIIWNGLSQATTYDLVMYDINAGQQVFFTTGIANRFIIPGAGLPPGSYSAYVRSVNAEGESGQWSKTFLFNIVVQNENVLDESIENETDKLPESTPFTPGEEPVQFVASTVTDELQNSKPVVLNSDQPVVETSYDPVASATVAASLDSVMVAWPDTDWWSENDANEMVAENSTDKGSKQAMIGGAALGLMFPFIQTGKATKTTGKISKKRRRQ